MKKTLLMYIMQIKDHNTLAQIYVSFKAGRWPDALPKRYKPEWFDNCLPNSREVYAELIQEHISSIVPPHIIEWWQDLRNKYGRIVHKPRNIKIPDLKTLK